jgi:hypothetical protein
MLTDTILIWKTRLQKTGTVPGKLHIFTRIAYLWRVIACFAGGFIAMFYSY